MSAVCCGWYASLLGGLAWLALARADILVVVGRAQHLSLGVRVQDVLALNKPLRWMKHAKSSTTNAQLVVRACLGTTADSAHRADDAD